MLYQKYFDEVIKIENKILSEEEGAINQAAVFMADTIRQGGLIHIFGCGHSHMLAEEAFYRAGGLVPVNPILDSAVMLHEGGVKSSETERMEHYARFILDRHSVKEDDVIFIYSTSGINGCTIDMALYAKEKKMKVIAVTSSSYKEAPSLHSSGKRLCDCADLVIDNHAPYGDALVSIPENNGKIAPGSTIFCALIWNLILCKLAEEQMERKTELQFYTSGNIPGGREKNRKYIEMYRNRIKAL